MSEKKRISILGGGFGGLYTALRLEKALAFDADKLAAGDQNNCKFTNAANTAWQSSPPESGWTNCCQNFFGGICKVTKRC